MDFVAFDVETATYYYKKEGFGPLFFAPTEQLQIVTF